MKKITFLINELGYSGVENQVISLANSLSDLYKIEIVCLKKLVDIKLNKKVVVKELNIKESIIGILYDNNLVKGINANIIDTDIVVVNDPLFNRVLDRLNFIDKYSIYWMHTRYDKDIDKLKRYNKVIIPNEKIYNEFKLENSVNIPNAIEISEVKTKYDIRNRIVFVGKLNKNKCLDLLIDVMEKVIVTNKNAILDIIGDGEERNSVFALIKEKRLEHNINMLGSLKKDEVLQKLRESTIFVTTSESEVFNLSILEAMSVGLPVVCLDSDSVRTLISDDIDGLIIKNRDILKMVSSINELLNDQNKCRDIGGCAIEKSMNFDINVLKREWIKIFK